VRADDVVLAYRPLDRQGMLSNVRSQRPVGDIDIGVRAGMRDDRDFDGGYDKRPDSSQGPHIAVAGHEDGCFSARQRGVLRGAAGGGAHLALDMVGGANDPNSTLAALGAPYRGGRLVLMGSSAVPLPIDYLQPTFNNLEIIGNFMHAQNAYLQLLALARSGQLDLRPIRPKQFRLSDLEAAMAYAATATSLELVVVTA
jgi:threonine dehydrogenase-like Zn-dependent dehydrogenase